MLNIKSSFIIFRNLLSYVFLYLPNKTIEVIWSIITKKNENIVSFAVKKSMKSTNTVIADNTIEINILIIIKSSPLFIDNYTIKEVKNVRY